MNPQESVPQGIAPKSNELHRRRPCYGRMIVQAFCVFSLMGILWGQRTTADSETISDSARNEASVATSENPGLRRYKGSAVAWQLWCVESFDRSRRENKPVFLMIGDHASSDFRQMQQKVLNQPEIARFLNEHFVSILVDRDERPELAGIYQRALRVYLRETDSNQIPGWPVILFLTPEGKPLGGGTTYSAHDRGDQPGLVTILKRLETAWRERREELVRTSDLLTQGISVEDLQASDENHSIRESKRLEEELQKKLFADFDEEFAGFLPDGNGGLKTSGAAQLVASLTSTNSINKEPDTRVIRTLNVLLEGGLQDHLGGGFFTASRDRQWRIPTFEKRLTDNVQLAEAYSQAYRQTNEIRYREAAEEALSFVLGQLSLPDGGFETAVFDEAGEKEGAYYLWTREDIQEALPPEEFAILRRYYALNDSPHLDRSYILRQSQELDTIGEELGLNRDQVELRLKQGQNRLRDIRQRRPSPVRDGKAVVSANGLAVRALARCGIWLNRPEYLRESEKTAMFLLTSLRNEGGRLHHIWMNNRPHGKALLEDYATTIQGLLALFQATADEKWLNAAVRLNEDQIAFFGDEAKGGFFQTARDHEDLLVRMKPCDESNGVSGNGLALQNLIVIHQLTNSGSSESRMDQAWKYLAGVFRNHPESASGLVAALGEYHGGSNPDSVVRVTQGGGSRKIMTLAAAQKKNTGDESGSNSRGVRKKEKLVDAVVYLSKDRLPAGEKVPFIVRVQMKKNWHINANKPGNEFAIGTELEMESKRDTKIFKIFFPKGKKVQEENLEGFTYQYEGQVDIKGLLEVPEEAGGQKEELTFTLSFQVCNDNECLKPDRLTVKLPIDVAPVGEVVESIHDELFKIPKKGEATSGQ